jgi:glyoxylase-like metal-dependent hydrolase (beta-lactamase superfamily II)/8-oxo-dGTP pyrophosphatase MutT (NUDIX family)
MAFAGDLFVFPGGRVDDADTDPRLGASPFEVAAIRELFEEAGVLLAERRGGGEADPAALIGARRALVFGETTFGAVVAALDLRLRADHLAPIARWTTPPVMPRRFDTRFFVAELPPGAEPTFTTDEVVEHRWLTARDALDALAAGELDMWVPTAATLQQVEYANGIDQIRERIVPGDAPAPRVIAERPGLTRVVVGSAGAVPGQTVNCYLVGEREVVAVDPGDPSDEAADAILATVGAGGGRVVAIALTHADPDHAAGAEHLALRLDLPIFAGPGAGHDLPSEVRELADGERVVAGDIELELVATPGPRPDHVAYAIRSPGMDPVLLAGDLVGGRADRAILRPPDEEAWSASLERVARLAPTSLYPGHGEPIAGDQ